MVKPIKFVASTVKSLCTHPNNSEKSKPPENKKEVLKQIYHLLKILEKFCSASEIVAFFSGGLLEKCCGKQKWLVDVLSHKCSLILEIKDNDPGLGVYIKKDVVSQFHKEYKFSVSDERFINLVLSAINPIFYEAQNSSGRDLFYYENEDYADFSELNLSCINLLNIDFHHCNFNNTDLSDTNVEMRNLLGSNLIGVIYTTVDPTFSKYDPYVAVLCLYQTISQKFGELEAFAESERQQLDNNYSHSIKVNLKCLNRFLQDHPDKKLKQAFSWSPSVRYLLSTEVNYAEFETFKTLCAQLRKKEIKG